MINVNERYQEMIARVRVRISDKDTLTYPTEISPFDWKARSDFQTISGKVKFTDSDIILEIDAGISYLRPEMTMAELPENEEYLVIKFVQISLFRTLAAWEARNYRISVDGISIAKSERVKNWLSVSEALEKELQEIVAGEGFATVEIGNLSRYSVRVNSMVGGDE